LLVADFLKRCCLRPGRISVKTTFITNQASN
jgi:hypothetical protein